MVSRNPRERCGVCGVLEPRPANARSAKRARERRLDEKTEMDRIKKRNTVLERHTAELQTRFTELTHEHNKLNQHRNLVFSLGANPERNLARLISKEAGSIKSVVSLTWKVTGDVEIKDYVVFPPHGEDNHSSLLKY